MLLELARQKPFEPVITQRPRGYTWHRRYQCFWITRLPSNYHRCGNNRGCRSDGHGRRNCNFCSVGVLPESQPISNIRPAPRTIPCGLCRTRVSTGWPHLRTGKPVRRVAAGAVALRAMRGRQ
jgi:hypothetical protein